MSRQVYVPTPTSPTRHTLADVLRAEIDLNAVSAGTPAVGRMLLERCLERKLTQRLRDIGEARIALEKYLADPSAAESMRQTDGTPPSRKTSEFSTRRSAIAHPFTKARKLHPERSVMNPVCIG